MGGSGDPGSPSTFRRGAGNPFSFSGTIIIVRLQLLSPLPLTYVIVSSVSSMFIGASKSYRKISWVWPHRHLFCYSIHTRTSTHPPFLTPFRTKLGSTPLIQEPVTIDTMSTSIGTQGCTLPFEQHQLPVIGVS